MIDGFRGDGHVVDQYIAGDHVRRPADGARTRRLRPVGAPHQLLIDIARLGMRPLVARQARRRVSGRVDVAYERYALFQELGRRFQRAGAVWVVETNALLSSEAKLERNALVLGRLAAALERRTYRRADILVCVSEPLRRMLLDASRVPDEKILVIPNGVDLARFQPSSVRAGEVAPAGRLVVGYIGYVIERQGLDELIRAVARLREEGLEVSAVIVGDGPDRSRLEELVSGSGLRGAVRFHDQVPWAEVPSWISSFSVGYSGQRGVEGMPMYHSPLKIYEYLAMERPVVASRHPDALVTIEEPGAGWTFTPGDVDELVDVLRRVCGLESEELSVTGERGRRHVRDHHTWGHRSRSLIDELRRRNLLP